MLREEINTALKGAMKARDERRVSTLRLVNAAIKNADIEAQLAGRPELADGDSQHLMAETDAEDRNVFLDESADHRHGIVPGRSRIARAV